MIASTPVAIFILVMLLVILYLSCWIKDLYDQIECKDDDFKKMKEIIDEYLESS